MKFNDFSIIPEEVWKEVKRKKIIMIRAEMNKIEKNYSRKKINKATGCFFAGRGKTNKMDVTSETFNREWENKDITKIRNEKEGTITDPTNIKRIIRKYLSLTLSTDLKNSLSCDIA